MFVLIVPVKNGISLNLNFEMEDYLDKDQNDASSITFAIGWDGKLKWSLQNGKTAENGKINLLSANSKAYGFATKDKIVRGCSSTIIRNPFLSKRTKPSQLRDVSSSTNWIGGELVRLI